MDDFELLDYENCSDRTPEPNELENFITIITQLSKEIEKTNVTELEKTIIAIKKIFCKSSYEIINTSAENSQKVDAISKLYDKMTAVLNELEKNRSSFS
jgi:hypothetical protein